MKKVDKLLVAEYYVWIGLGVLGVIILALLMIVVIE